MNRSRLLLIVTTFGACLVWGLSESPARQKSEVAIAAGPVRSDEAPSSDSGVYQIILTPEVRPGVTAPEPTLDWGVDSKGASQQKAASDQPARAQGVIVGPRQTAPVVRKNQAPAPDPLAELVAQQDARQVFSDTRDSAPRPSNAGTGQGAPGFVSGYRVPAAVEESDPTPVPTRTALPRDESQLPWVRGQARGYAMLYAMHPRARQLVEQQVQALIDARIRQPYISVLIDGTFGQDFEYLKGVINRLSTNGRALTLALYLTNGPTMRRYDTTPIDVLFTKYEPGIFRDLIVNDSGVRNMYAGVVRKAKELFDSHIANDPQSRNVAIVMLEDNLDYRSYAAMRTMAGEQLGDGVTFTRNPCVGCYSDGLSDGDTQGDQRELHRTEDFRYLTKGDGYTLDGVGFEYPDTDDADSESPNSISSDGVLQMMSEAYARDFAFVGLWRHGWQGVREGVANKHPDERTYVLSTPAQVQFEISALRHGLVEEE